MKVCMIDFHYDLISQNDGSAQKVIKDFASNLEADVSCISVSYDKYKEKIENNVKYYAVPENKIKNKIFNKILNLKVFTYDLMINIIEKEKFEILHFHNRFELVDKLVSKLSYKPKIICHFHREFKSLIIPKSADLILGVSEKLAKFIKQKSNTEKKVDYIHNPIPYDVFLFQKKSFLPINEPIKLLFAFGDNEKKGYKEVLESLKFLENNNIKYELHLCGNKKPLNFENKNIKVYGFLNNRKIFNLMQKTDILLFPSYSEGLPLTILESLYFANYIITSKVGGIPEIFGDYDFYCDLNAKSIYENIIKIKNIDIKEYESLRDKILEKFDIKNLSNQLLNKYKEILSE